MKTFVRYVSLGVVVAGVIVIAPVRADDGPFAVRVRGLYLSPTDTSSSVNTGEDFYFNSASLIEIDGEWYFSRHFSTEIAVGTSTRLTTRVYTNAFAIQPSTLTVKYDANPLGRVRPYLGIGIVRAGFSTTASSSEFNVSSSTYGLVVQAGMDFMVESGWFVNLDLKYAQMTSTWTEPPCPPCMAGPSSGQLRGNSTLIGAGVGYRF